MILLAAFAVALIIALLRGGKLSRLAHLPVRNTWLILMAFVLQIYLVYVPAGKTQGLTEPAAVLHIASYVLLLTAIWQNRHLPGITVMAVGVLLNLAVILANGGFMPIEPEAVRQLGHEDRVVSLEPGYRVYKAKDVVLPREQTRLWLLSDIFVIAPPFPIRSAFSPGDVLLSTGVFVLLQRVMVSSSGRPGHGDEPARFPAALAPLVQEPRTDSSVTALPQGDVGETPGG